MRVDPDVLQTPPLGVWMYAGLWTPGTAVIHRKDPSPDVNTIDRNIDYRSKCSSMNYDKTNGQSIAMKADRSPAMVSLNVYITGDGLTKYLQKQHK